MKKEIETEPIEGSRLRLVKALIKKNLGKLIKQRTLESAIREIENSGGTLIVNININDPRLTELIVMENNGQIGGKEEAYG